MIDRFLFFSHPLFGHSFCPFPYLFRVSKVVVLDKNQPVVKFKDIRNCRRQVQVGNIRIGNSFEMLDDSAQAVTMGDYQQLSLYINAGKMMHFQ